MGIVEAIFAIVLGLIVLAAAAIPAAMFIHCWWTDDLLRDSPQDKWKRRGKKRKTAKLAAEESGLPMYERIARSYERKAEAQLTGNRPEDALRYVNKAKEIRDRAMQDMANGEFL